MNTIPDADRRIDSVKRLLRGRHRQLLLSVIALVASLLLLIKAASAAQPSGQVESPFSPTVSTTYSGSLSVTHVPTSTIASPTPVAIPTVTANPVVATSSSTQTIFGITVDSQSPSFAIIVEAISVLLFGSILALILEWQSRRYQRSQERSTSNEAKYRYLLGIKREIELILEPFESWMKVAGDSESYREMQDRGQDVPDISSSFLNILDWGKTTYWDALVPSGLLPSLASPDLLAQIADFYQHLYILVRHISDVIRGEEQRALRIAGQGKYAAMAEALVNAPHEAEKARQIGKDLEQFLLLGKKALDGLEEELNRLSAYLNVPIEMAKPSVQESVSEPKQDAGFKDITLLNLNEHLTKRGSESQRANRYYYQEKEDPELFTFVLRLSDKPPAEWGEDVDFGPLIKQTDRYGRRYWVHQYTATVKGRYLLVESRKDKLVEHVPYLRLAVAQKNETYRKNLANKSIAREQEAQQAALQKQEMIEFKKLLDSEIGKDIDLESIRSQLEDTKTTGDDYDDEWDI